MKINREDKPPIVVGKRVTFGQIIGGVVTALAFAWDATNPDKQLSAGVVMGVTTALTGVAQIIIANRYGITGQ